ncbi:MAG: hypothetical protein OCD00_11865 [Colwellia sp.]
MSESTDLPKVLTYEHKFVSEVSVSGTLTAFYPAFGYTPNYKFTNFLGSLTFFNKDFIFTGNCSAKYSNNSSPFTWPVTIRYNERRSTVRISILDMSWEWSNIISSNEIELIYDIDTKKAFISILENKIGDDPDASGSFVDITMRRDSSIVLE